MRQMALSEAADADRERATRNGRELPGAAGVLNREDILSAAEVAELLQLRRSTVEDYARRGVLPSIKLGRSAGL